MKREPSFANFIAETFDILKDAPGWTVGYIVLVTLFNSVSTYAQGGDAMIGLSWGFSIDAELLSRGALAVLTVVGVAFVGIVVQYFYLAHLLAHRGFSNGRNRILPYLGVSLLYVLGMIFGFILLIIPGLILIVRWQAATPYVVGTDTGVIDAFGKSWDLTSGHGWSIFFGLFILGLLGGALGVVFGLPFYSALEEVSIFVSELLSIMLGVLFLAFSVAIFYLLEDNTQEVSDVFS